jgi:hypothetical protein
MNKEREPQPTLAEVILFITGLTVIVFLLAFILYHTYQL